MENSMANATQTAAPSACNPDQSFQQMRIPSDVSIPNELFQSFRQKILSGEFPPGYMFPNELELCQKLNVGRSSLREAMSACATLGLITRTRRGTYVNKSLDYVAVTPLGELLKQSDVKDLMEFRVMIEAELASLAAQRASRNRIGEMRSNVQTMAKLYERSAKGKIDSEEASRLTKVDTEFHLMLADMAENHLMSRIMNVVRNMYETIICNVFVKENEIIPRAVKFHTLIANAIEQHDPAEARKITYAHIMDVSDTIDRIG